MSFFYLTVSFHFFYVNTFCFFFFSFSLEKNSISYFGFFLEKKKKIKKEFEKKKKNWIRFLTFDATLSLLFCLVGQCHRRRWWIISFIGLFKYIKKDFYFLFSKDNSIIYLKKTKKKNTLTEKDRLQRIYDQDSCHMLARH